MATQNSTTFRAPAEWPNAKTEKALDTAFERLDALAVKVGQARPRDEGAATLKRDALAHMRAAKSLLFRAYHAEMDARLALWRGLGYSM